MLLKLELYWPLKFLLKCCSVLWTITTSADSEGRSGGPDYNGAACSCVSAGRCKDTTVCIDTLANKYLNLILILSAGFFLCVTTIVTSLVLARFLTQQDNAATTMQKLMSTTSNILRWLSSCGMHRSKHHTTQLPIRPKGSHRQSHPMRRHGDIPRRPRSIAQQGRDVMKEHVHLGYKDLNLVCSQE